MIREKYRIGVNKNWILVTLLNRCQLQVYDTSELDDTSQAPLSLSAVNCVTAQFTGHLSSSSHFKLDIHGAAVELLQGNKSNTMILKWPLAPVTYFEGWVDTRKI